MGHLINPISFRLRFFKNWINKFYSRFNNFYVLFCFFICKYFGYNKLVVLLNNFGYFFATHKMFFFKGVFNCVLVFYFRKKNLKEFSIKFSFLKFLLLVFRRRFKFNFLIRILFFLFKKYRKVLKCFIKFKDISCVKDKGDFKRFLKFYLCSRRFYLKHLNLVKLFFKLIWLGFFSRVRLVRLIFLKSFFFFKNFFNKLCGGVFFDLYEYFYIKSKDLGLFDIVLKSNFIMSSSIFLNFFILCFRKQKRFIFRLIKLFVNFLKICLKKRRFIGFKFIITGRFLKKEKAVCLKYFGGKISVSNIVKPVDFSNRIIITKFGVANLKLWLFFN